MSDDSAGAAAPHYRAFISYSHADGRFAGWLHRRLEAARLPDKQRLAPIFIDRAELAAGPDLSAQVREALAQSAALIIVASPAARASRWVGQEIALFRQLHPGRRILAALIDGEPGEAFPDALLSHEGVSIEPLAADFRKGQDGKRLGLLKIVAGLTALPLDRLVQRDAQTRQRRVMAVTAGAVILSLILAAALVLAIRARAEAERQRSEAEGLVEFMLTDLRDKLKGVGRIDVMDAVNQRAFGFYEQQFDIANLSPDSLDRRARVISAMGEDDENRGSFGNAFAKYFEYDRIMSALLAKDPMNPDRIYAKAKSENRLGLFEATRGKLPEAIKRFENANSLLGTLPATAQQYSWIELRSLVSGNLCAISIKARRKNLSAADHCRQAVSLAQGRLRQEPNNRSIRYDLAFHYLWLDSALEASGDKAGASRARTLGWNTSEDLLRTEPGNMLFREQHLEIAMELAKIARREGDLASAKKYLTIAKQDARILTSRDPENRNWLKLQTKFSNLEKEILK